MTESIWILESKEPFSEDGGKNWVVLLLRKQWRAHFKDEWKRKPEYAEFKNGA